MKSTNQDKAISFKDTLRFFGNWRRASIPVQLCFLGRPQSSENVRVSIDGLVSLVDARGIVTVSGNGRKIDLDLRGTQVTCIGSAAVATGKLHSLDPDSLLQVKFPDGEICLISVSPGAGARWMRNRLPSTAVEDRPAAKSVNGLFTISSLANNSGTASRPRTSKTGPPLFPMGAFLLLFMLITLTLTPSSVPRLLAELGVRQKMSDPAAMVWVISQDGNYYCAGSVLNGRRPGKWMNQAQALTLGYQPAAGNYCAEGADSSADRQGNRFLNYYRAVRENGKALFLRLARISYSWLDRT